MRRHLDLSLGEDACFWFACLVAFYGFLRKSSLLPKNKQDVAKSILSNDLSEVNSSSFLIAIRHSKTIQFGQRVLMLPYTKCTVKRLCPVHALTHHLLANKPPLAARLFTYATGKSRIILTQNVFAARLKRILGLAGFDATTISCHSFRRGGTSMAISCGLNPLQVKARGDWKSNAFESYVFLSDRSELVSA